MEEEKINNEEKDKNYSKDIKKNNSGSKLIIILIIIFSLILVLAVFSTIFALLNISNSNIISGTKINGIDVSGLSKEDAKNKLKLIYEEKLKTDITLKYKEYETTINPVGLNISYDIDSAINEAFSNGRSDNIFINNYNILFTLIGKKNILVNLNIDEEAYNKQQKNIESEIPGVIEEPDYYIEDNNLIITKGKDGLKIDSEKLLNYIKNNLDDLTIKGGIIEIPLYIKKVDKIDIEKIHNEVYKEVKDASYKTEPTFEIYPEVEGIDFSVEEAKKIINSEEKDEYIIPLTITKPKVTTNDIGSEAFPYKICYFTTNYDASLVDRSTNLRLACEKLNGKVVMPGDIFSYNATLGERTRAAGYRNAAIYENGQVVDGLGGGICQISSTLYNAVLLANMEIVERSNHQFITSYLPAGRDATVVYGLTDFKFKNTRKYAVKIKAWISNGIVTIEFYGIKEENEYTTTFSTKTISTIPFTVKYVDDPTLDVGKEKIKQRGVNGLITETYITKSLNGVPVSTTLLSRDTYNAMQKIILRGTKKAVQESTTQKVENQENIEKDINTID